MTKATPLTLRLAHINDLHSHFEPSALTLELAGQQQAIQCGGIGLVSSALEKQRQRAEQDQTPFLFLDAGDSFQGSLYFSLYKGEVNAVLQNILAADATVLGNHEFDLGNDYALRYINALTHPVMASNWDVSSLARKPHHLKSFDVQAQCGEYIVREFNGHRVAIMGITLDNMADIAHPSEKTPFLDVEKALNAMISDAHRQNIFNIIVLSHLGYPRDLDLAKRVSGISVLIGGHTHTWQGDFSTVGLENSEPYGRRVADTLVFQASCNGYTLGVAELSFNERGVATLIQGQNTLLVDEKSINEAQQSQLQTLSCVALLQEDPRVTTALSPYRCAVDALMNQNIAKAQTLLRHIRVPTETLSSEVAPIVCDAFVWQANERGLKVDCAIHNAGGVRVDVAEGDLSAGEVAGRLLPFAIDVVRFEVKGKILKAALEGAINNAINRDEIGSGDGSYPYTSHLRYQYQRSKQKGQRIVNLALYRNAEWQPIDDEGLYWVASSSYTALGKEGYEAFLGACSKPESIGVTMADAFIAYAQQQSVLSAPTEQLVELIA
ncbi:bifunctional metallophosphatase/5'-nucleotidase [Thaumasiovibrio subtropicus]|uniref:bifunctional metallophosphatase/5'-nucleotidase n=1 Tax=Thaumasiovibrio subtropicus TaxID=1891207 RepID=UPI000B3503C7|nr:bifunctional UDP-sugar hydrolase/5'-nucleotidase [Thaumasiovibrio subtropicus]